MKILKMLLYPFLIRSKIKRMIKNVTKEREYFKSTLKWNEDNTDTDIKYLESRIELKNEVLYQLRDLL